MHVCAGSYAEHMRFGEKSFACCTYLVFASEYTRLSISRIRGYHSYVRACALDRECAVFSRTLEQCMRLQPGGN